MNISILIKAQGLNDICIFFLINLIILTYWSIYQIENPIKLNKKLTILVKIILMKWDIELNLTKQNDMFGQNDQWVLIKLDILIC